MASSLGLVCDLGVPTMVPSAAGPAIWMSCGSKMPLMPSMGCFMPSSAICLRTMPASVITPPK